MYVYLVEECREKEDDNCSHSPVPASELEGKVDMPAVQMPQLLLCLEVLSDTHLWSVQINVVVVS